MPKEFESPAAPYESLEKLRADHITMMQVVGRKGHWRDLVPEIRKLIDRVKATGRRLYDPSDREVAQNVISYWASDLFEGDEPGALSAALPQLDAFDSASAPDVSTAPNPYKGLSAFGEADAEQFHGRRGPRTGSSKHCARSRSFSSSDKWAAARPPSSWPASCRSSNRPCAGNRRIQFFSPSRPAPTHSRHCWPACIV